MKRAASNGVGVTTVLLLASLCACASIGRKPRVAEHWVGTWLAANYAQENVKGEFAGDTTLRQIVHVSVGGSTLRLVLTNEFGSSDLTIGGISVALPTPPQQTNQETPFDSGLRPSGEIDPKSVADVRFGGSVGVTIPAGAVAISDPVALKLKPLSDLAVTLFLPGQTIRTVSRHDWADQTNFESAGDDLHATALSSPRRVQTWRFLKGVEVQGQAKAAIVCLGDSITDGAPSKLNANHRYPDVLARRLQASRDTAGLGVLNAGIGGNSVLHDDGFAGPNALARFDRDVLSQAGVKYVIVLEGINDIGRLAAPKEPGDVITADSLIVAYKQMIVRAHAHGIKVIGATLTPYQGAHTDSEAGQAVREAVNDFIRRSGEFDGVVDFAQVTADPGSPKRYSADVDSPDHLHPGDAGYQIMGDSIDLRLFTP